MKAWTNFRGTVAALCVGLLFPIFAGATTYTITNLTGLSEVDGIDDAGEIVGYAREGGKLTPVTYINGQIRSIPPAGTGNALWQVEGISSSGTIFGNKAQGGEYGFLDVGGSFTYFQGNDPSDLLILRHVTDSGQVVGDYSDRKNNFNGFVYSNGTFTSLAVPGARQTSAESANNDEVVGTWEDFNNIEFGFIYKNGIYTSFAVPGSVQTQIWDVSNDGTIIGDYTGADGVPLGYIYKNGQFTTLRSPCGPYTIAFAINGQGEVGGDGYDSASGYCAFVYSDGAYSIFGGQLQTNPVQFRGFNDLGVVVGEYTAPGQPVAFLATPNQTVPEPSLFCLLGILGVGIVLKRFCLR